MNFPISGLVLLSLGAYLLVFAPRMLYLATVFLIPFSAMAVANVGWGGDHKGIAAWIFMGTLWILRTSISHVPFWKRAGWRLTRRARIELLALLACACVSLLVPLIVNGTNWIEYFRLYSNERVPLRLDAQRITQTGYFAFGIIFTIFVAVENCDAKRLLQSVRAYLCSAMFVSLWAFVQLWCNLTGHTYPAFLFNTSMGTSAQLYTERLSELDLARVSSVAVEPSQLAFSMLLAFVILLVSIGLRRPVLTKGWDLLTLVLVTAALIVSTATTAYLGLVLASGLVFIVLMRTGTARWWHGAVAVGVVACCVVALLALPLVHDLFNLVVLAKAEGGSGMERLKSISLGIRYFREYPIFGASWNVVSSADLLFQVLSGLGIVGFGVLTVFLTNELRRLWVAPARGSRWSQVLFPAVCLMVCLSELAGFPFPMGYVWFALGLGISAPFIVTRTAEGAVRSRRAVSIQRVSDSDGTPPLAGCPQES